MSIFVKYLHNQNLPTMITAIDYCLGKEIL